LLVHGLNPSFTVSVLRVDGLNLGQRSRIYPFRDLTAEERIEATRYDYRVEGRVRDELKFASPGQEYLVAPLVEYLHSASFEFGIQIASAGIEGLVIVVVCVYNSSLVSHGHLRIVINQAVPVMT
jgi:hypothetical protein